MKSEELNQLIKSFHRNVLIVHEDVDARDVPVILPAGVEINLILLGKVFGTVNVGGYSAPKAPKADFARLIEGGVEVRSDGQDKRERGGFLRLANEKLNPEVYTLTEFGVPIAWGVHVTAKHIDADGRPAGLFIDRAVASSFDAHVKGAKVIGIGMKHCRNSRLTGSVDAIGVAGVTGQGYGVQLQESRGCSIIGVHGTGCRYIVSLTGGGVDNEVRHITGRGTEADCDIHGGGEENAVFFEAGRVKLFNEAWQMDPINARAERCLYVARTPAEFLTLKSMRGAA